MLLCTNGGTELIGRSQDEDRQETLQSSAVQRLANIEVNPLIEGSIPRCFEVWGVGVWEFGLRFEGLGDRHYLT